jgi:hypothetical protein
MGRILAGETFDIQCFIASWLHGFMVRLLRGIDRLAWGDRETMNP